MAFGPGTHSCHPRSGSCPAPKACEQEVNPVTITLPLGAEGACAGESRGCEGDRGCSQGPFPWMSGLNGEEALGEGPSTHAQNSPKPSCS